MGVVAIMRQCIVHAACGLWISAACGILGVNAAAAEPRLNQIQVVGTHNSYHLAPEPAVRELIAASGRRRAEAIDYSHSPLEEQFSRLGIRQIELDVYSDPNGGLFASPAARQILRGMGKDPGADPNTSGELQRPGIKVLHVPDFDYRTTVPTFVGALKQVRGWSEANRHHVPILILAELKVEALPGMPTRPVPFGRAEIDEVESEILSVFARTEILTPDMVRGRSPSLREAIRSRGWPAVDAVRGLVMFALDNEGSVRDLYLDGHQALERRLLFVTVAESHPAAGWFKVNDPVKDFDRIQHLVRAGFLVRTRADADTLAARKDDVTQRDRALASGAQFVSTDYPEPDRRLSSYCVRLSGGCVARPNPVSGEARWGQIDLESSKLSSSPRPR
jgi:hypothetical protein